jgi:hypothetical protein
LARTSKHPLLELLPPQRIDIPGSRLQDIDSPRMTPQEA